MLIKPYVAPDGYFVSLQNCFNDEKIAGIVGWGKMLGIVASVISVDMHEAARIRRTAEMCQWPRARARIATAPASASATATDPGHGSAEHRSAWTPSDPRRSIVPRGGNGWPRGDDRISKAVGSRPHTLPWDRGIRCENPARQSTYFWAGST
jgi:hypothetical protein